MCTTVAIQREDNSPWKHGTIIVLGDANHNDRSYKLMVMT